MKGNPMKEKVILSISLTCLIGIMWLNSNSQTLQDNEVAFEEKTILPLDISPVEFINDESPETTYVNEISTNQYSQNEEACFLTPTEADLLTFGSAFQYYRECLGNDSSFKWKGSTYTTVLAEEVIIQIADTLKIKEEDNIEATVIH